jgi:glycerophosphoryl diester phosphodiesterase
MSTSQDTPFVVAHRAGNDLARLRAAEALRLPLVEADVHLFAGRLEVRHLKTVGPIPILWDRWELAAPWAPRMVLDELLAAVSPGTELMLDLKGHDARLPARIAEALETAALRGRLTVCSQDWRLLEPLSARPDIRVVHSVGNARQLARLWRRDDGLAGVSIHQRLLDADVVEELRRRAAVVLSWPVETVAQARRLTAWGVQGLISRHFEDLAGALDLQASEDLAGAVA